LPLRPRNIRVATFIMRVLNKINLRKLYLIGLFDQLKVFYWVASERNGIRGLHYTLIRFILALDIQEVFVISNSRHYSLTEMLTISVLLLYQPWSILEKWVLDVWRQVLVISRVLKVFTRRDAPIIGRGVLIRFQLEICTLVRLALVFLGVHQRYVRVLRLLLHLVPERQLRALYLAIAGYAKKRLLSLVVQLLHRFNILNR
jgi:hypothetical protein